MSIYNVLTRCHAKIITLFFFWSEGALLKSCPFGVWSRAVDQQRSTECHSQASGWTGVAQRYSWITQGLGNNIMARPSLPTTGGCLDTGRLAFT